MKAIFIDSSIFFDSYKSKLSFERLYYYCLDTKPNYIICSGLTNMQVIKYNLLVKRLTSSGIKFINQYSGIISDVIYDTFHVITKNKVYIERQHGTVIELDLVNNKFNYVFLDLLNDEKYAKYHHLKYPLGLHGRTSILVSINYNDCKIFN